MPSSLSRRRVFLGFSVLLGGLVGLGGCLGRSGPSRFYVLTPLEGMTATPRSDASQELAVMVGPVALPGYVDRPQIVTRRDRDQLDVAEFDRWAEPLVEAVPRLLAENLGILLGSDGVGVYPLAPGGSARYQVIVDVTRFDGVTGGEVALDARWRVLDPTGREVALRRTSTREATGGAGYGRLVDAMSRALGALSRDIADVLARG